MNKSISARILRGLSANAYGQVVTVVVQLVGVPVLLSAWGVRLYGEWLILFAIPSYLSMTDLGFSLSAANDMTASVAAGDRSGALVVFESLFALVFGIVAAGLVVLSALAYWLPWGDWLHLQALGADSVSWILWLLCAQVLVSLLDGVNHAGYRANGEYALHVGMNNSVRLLQFSGLWVAALLGYGPIIAAATFLVVRTIGTLVVALLLTHRNRWLHFSLAHARSAELRRLWKPALANVAIPMAQALNVQGIVLVIGLVLSPLAVVVFTTLRTLSRLVQRLAQAVTHAVEPELAAADGLRDTTLVRTLFGHALRGSFWLAALAAGGLALFGTTLLDFWTRGKVAMEPALFAWLLGAAMTSVFWYGTLSVLKAANRHVRVALFYTLTSAGAVVASVFALQLTSSIAAVAAVLLALNVSMVIYTAKASAYFLGASPLLCFVRALDPLPLLSYARSKLVVH